MVTFETLIQNLQEIYFFSYFMPFILVLAVTYGIIDKINLFEDNTVDATVSIVVAFMSLLGIYLLDISGVMIYFWGALSVGLVTVLGFVILAGMFGVDITQTEFEKKWIGISGAIIIAVVLVIVNEFLAFDVGAFIYTETAMTLLSLAGMIAVVYFIVRNDKK